MSFGTGFMLGREGEEMWVRWEVNGVEDERD